MILLTALLIAALTVVAIPARADVVVSGSFTINFVNGVLGPDLVELLGNENGYQATFTGVDFVCVPGESPPFPPPKVLQMRAASFQLTFSGPDADFLNEVASQLTRGAFEPDVYLVVNDLPGPPGDGQTMRFGFWPQDVTEGITFIADAWSYTPWFPLDGDSCVVISSVSVPARVILSDTRGSNDGLVVADSATLDLQLLPTVTEAVTWGRIKGLYR